MDIQTRGAALPLLVSLGRPPLALSFSSAAAHINSPCLHWLSLQVITRMAMLDSGRALIEWTLSGGLAGAGQVSVPMTSTFELNLLTGRVMTHTCVWGWRRAHCGVSCGTLIEVQVVRRCSNTMTWI